MLAGTDDSIPEYSCVDVHGDVILEGLSVLELGFYGGLDEINLSDGGERKRANSKLNRSILVAEAACSPPRSCAG